MLMGLLVVPSMILSSVMWSARVPEFLFATADEGHSWWRVGPGSSVMAWRRFGLEDLRRTGEWHSAECVVEFGGEGRNRELDSRVRS